MDNKPNDWMLSIMDNPSFDLARFNAVGITPDNTSLESRDFYKNSNYIRQLFTDPQTNKFDEVAFNKMYDAALNTYNAYAAGQYESNLISDLEFDPINNLRPFGSKVKTPRIEIEKVSNPLRQKTGTSRLGWTDDPTITPLEAASASKVFNFSDNKFEDYTADDMSLFSNPIKFLESIINPLVLATYDEDGTHVDPISGRTVQHKKGDMKVNDDGDYYFETLGGRSTRGKQVKSAFDSLTAESSTLNKYDFFDSDDLDKSITGTIMKSAVQIAPLVIGGPISGFYGAAMVGKELMSILPNIYNMTLGNITGEIDPLNRLEAISSALSTTSSQYAKEHPVAFENLMTIITDVALQQAQQRTVFNWMNKVTGNTARTNLLLGMPMGAEFNKLKEAVRMGNQTASNAALGYMAMSQGLETYNDGIELGLSPIEASLTAWGAIAGMYAIDKSGLGEIFFPELSYDERVMRKAINPVAKVFNKGFETIAEAPKSKNKLINLWNKAKDNSFKHWSVDENITGFWDAVQTHSLNLFGKMMGEGLEEAGEELASDMAKSLYNGYAYITGKDPDKTFNILEDAPERYGMSFLGGAIGGAVFEGINIVNSLNLSNLTNQELIYLLRNGNKREILSELDKLYKKGKLGNANLSAQFDETSEGRIWKTTKNNSESLNHSVYMATKRYIEAMDKAIHQGGFNISDDDVINKMYEADTKVLLLLGLDIIKNGYEHQILNDFQQLTSDYVAAFTARDVVSLDDKEQSKYAQILKDNGNESFEDKVKKTSFGLSDTQQLKILDYHNATEKLKEIEKLREEFFSGQYATTFLDQMLFLMDVPVSAAFYKPTLDLYVTSKTGKHLNELTEDEVNKYTEAYREYLKSTPEGLDKSAYNLYKEYSEKFSSLMDALKDKHKKMLSIIEYLRTQLYSMPDTYGYDPSRPNENTGLIELQDPDDPTKKYVTGKYLLPGNESMHFEGMDHIDSVDKHLRNELGVGLNSKQVLRRDLIYMSEDMYKEYLIQRGVEPEALVLLPPELEEARQEHNEKAYNKLKDIIDHLKAEGVVDSETKNALSKLLSEFISPFIKSNFSKENLGLMIDSNQYPDIFDKLDISKLQQIIQNSNTQEEIADLINNSSFKVMSFETYLKMCRDLAQLEDIDIDELLSNILTEIIDIPEEAHSYIELLRSNHPDAEAYILDYAFTYVPINSENELLLSLLSNYLEELAKDKKNLANAYALELFNAANLKLRNNKYFLLLNDLKTTIANSESPLHDFIADMSITLFGQKLSIFEFFEGLDSIIEATQNLADYVLGLNASKQIELALYVLNIVGSLILATSTTEKFGHNSVVIEFAKEHNLQTKYQTLDAETVTDMLKEIAYIQLRLNFVDDLNRLNSANLFKELSKAEALITKLVLQEFLAKEENSFIKKLTVNIDDKSYSLFKGLSDLLLGNDTKELRKLLDSVLNLIWSNWLKIKEETNLSDEVLVENLVKSIPDDVKSKLQLQESTAFDSKTESITLYDLLIFTLASALMKKTNFNFYLNSALEGEDVAPLFPQIWNIFVAAGVVTNKTAFNALLKGIKHLDLYVINNLVHIDGGGGTGKTSAVATLTYKIAKILKSDLKVALVGPTSKQVANLKAKINGDTYTIEEFKLKILSNSDYTEYSESLTKNGVDDKFFTDQNQMKEEAFDAASTDYDLIIFDEISLVPKSDIYLLSKAAKKGTILGIGDIYQQYNIPTRSMGNISAGDILAIHAPRLNISMRVQNVAKKQNADVFLSILKKVQQDAQNSVPFDVTLLFIANTLFFHYVERDGILYGDKKVTVVSKEDWENILRNTKGSVAVVYDNTNSDTMQNLESVLSMHSDWADKIVKLTKEEILGSEFDLVVVDIQIPKLNFTSEVFALEHIINTLYTMSTRGKEGVTFVDNNLSSIISEENFIRDKFIDFSPEPTEIIKKYREEYFLYLAESLEGYEPPKEVKEAKAKAEEESKKANETEEEIKAREEELEKEEFAGEEPPVIEATPGSTVDEDFEEELGVLTDTNRRNKNDTSDVSVNLSNIRSYGWYMRYGMKETADGYQYTDNDNSDLNLTRVFDTSKTHATDSDILLYHSLRDLALSGQTDNISILKNIIALFGIYDKNVLNALLAGFSKGKYYIERRKTNKEFDTPLFKENVDDKAIKLESFNVVYKFEYNGLVYSITCSKLAHPNTWIKYLRDNNKITTEAEEYKKIYDDWVNSLNRGDILEDIPLDKANLSFNTSARLVPIYGENGRESYKLSELRIKYPHMLISNSMYIYANEPEYKYFLDSKLKGTRCISLIAPSKYSYAQDTNGNWVRITDGNIRDLYVAAKKRLAEGKPANCPIRAVICDSSASFIFDRYLSDGLKVQGFFSLTPNSLGAENFDADYLKLKVFDSRKTINTELLMILAMWNRMMDLRRLYESIIRHEDIKDTDLGFVLINSSLTGYFKYSRSTLNGYFNVKLKLGSNDTFVYINLDTCEKALLTLQQFFLLLGKFTKLPISMEDLALITDPKSNIELEKWSLTHELVYKGNKTRKSPILYPTSLLRATSHKKAIIDLTTDDGARRSMSLNNMTVSVGLLMLQYFRRLSKSATEGRHLDDTHYAKLIDKMSIKDDDGNILAVFSPGTAISESIKSFPNNTSGKNTGVSFMSTLYNIIFHGRINPYDTESPQVRVEGINSSNGSRTSLSMHLVPFPNGIYHRPVYEGQEELKGLSLYKAVNLEQFFTIDVMPEYGTIGVSIGDMNNEPVAKVLPSNEEVVMLTEELVLLQDFGFYYKNGKLVINANDDLSNFDNVIDVTEELNNLNAENISIVCSDEGISISCKLGEELKEINNANHNDIVEWLKTLQVSTVRLAATDVNAFELFAKEFLECVELFFAEAEQRNIIISELDKKNMLDVINKNLSEIAELIDSDSIDKESELLRLKTLLGNAGAVITDESIINKVMRVFKLRVNKFLETNLSSCKLI